MKSIVKIIFLSLFVCGVSFAGPTTVKCSSIEKDVFKLEAIFGSEGSVLESLEWEGAKAVTKFPPCTQLFFNGKDDAQFYISTYVGNDPVVYFDLKTVGASKKEGLIYLGGVVTAITYQQQEDKRVENKKIVPITCIADPF